MARARAGAAPMMAVRRGARQPEFVRRLGGAPGCSASGPGRRLDRAHRKGCARKEAAAGEALTEIVSGHLSQSLGLHAVRAGLAEDRVDPFDELARAERLGDVVVGADLEADLLVDVTTLGRQQDD